MQVSIKEVNNGFMTIDQHDQEYVFNSFDGLVNHLRVKLDKPQEKAVVISLEDRYPQAFKDGMD